jgi:hypothetical protein
LFFVGGAQTPSPLIRPEGTISGGAVRGKVKTRAVNDWTVFVLDNLLYELQLSSDA